jgi:uncharacterized protein (TIGR00290 family)
MSQNVVLNWSSGKDAALAFHLLQQTDQYKVTALLTTINAEVDRVFMHGTREALLDAQASAMGLPLTKVRLPPSPDNTLYEAAMKEALDAFISRDINSAAYGDIFLEDLRSYREAQLASVGFGAIFPLWNIPTTKLIHLLDEAEIRAIRVCVDGSKLGPEWLGKTISPELAASLPEGVDPCGENGEFHTFVYQAPYFKAPISFATGEIVHRTYLPDTAGFHFLNIIPTT